MIFPFIINKSKIKTRYSRLENTDLPNWISEVQIKQTDQTVSLLQISLISKVSSS